MAVTKITYNNGMIFKGDLNNSLFHPEGRKEFENYDVSKQGYNKGLYDYYINHFQYSNAYKYASMFHYKDPEEEKVNNAQLVGLRMENARREALARNITDPKQAEALDFNEAVFKEGGTAYLDPNKNRFVKEFEDYKNRLGSVGDRKANKVKITFQREKSKLFGIDWLDWVSKDNPNNFKNFKDEFGYSDDYLRDKGISIEDNNGEVSLTFDKNNTIANTLLYNIASSEHAQEQGAKEINIIGIDDKGEISDGKDNVPGVARPYYEIVAHSTLNKHVSDLRHMRDVINEAERDKNSLEQTAEGEGMFYSSRIYGYSSDRVEQLWRQFYAAEDDPGLRTIIKGAIDHENETIYNKIMELGLGNYDVSTNYFENDGQLRLIDSSQVAELTNVLTDGLAHGNAIFQDMESGGRFGTVVTIPAKNVGDPKKEKPEISIFIQGFREDEILQKVASDNVYSAIHELDLIEQFGTTYELHDGRVIGQDSFNDGKNIVKQFYLKDQDGNKLAMTQKDLLPLLEEETGINKIYAEAYDKHTNADGEIIDNQQLNKELGIYAVALANNTYTDTEQIKLEDVFDETGRPKSIEARRKDISYGANSKLSAAMRIYFMLKEKFSWME